MVRRLPKPRIHPPNHPLTHHDRCLQTSRARSQGSFCIATIATGAASATSKRNARNGFNFFSGRRHRPPLSVPTLAGVSTAVAMMGGVAVTCMAVASSAYPAAAMLAAESTSKDVSNSSVSRADGEGEEDNASLVAAAHELRRTLTPPHQSLFRVVCILVYEDRSGNLHRITGKYVMSIVAGLLAC